MSYGEKYDHIFNDQNKLSVSLPLKKKYGFNIIKLKIITILSIYKKLIVIYYRFDYIHQNS